MGRIIGRIARAQRLGFGIVVAALLHAPVQADDPAAPAPTAQPTATAAPDPTAASPPPPAVDAKPAEARTPTGAQPQNTLTIYTSFEPERLKPVLDEFAKANQVTLAFVVDQPDLLLGRLLREGAASPADLLLLPNAARLERAAAAGLLRMLSVDALTQAIPEPYRDPEARWYGLASFAWVILAGPDRVKPGDVSRYQDLAKPEWQGRLCLAPLDRPAGLLLLASLFKRDGADTFVAWLDAVRQNAVALPLAGAPANAEDRTALDGLVTEKCDIALLGTRTLTRTADTGSDKEKAAINRSALIWPNQNGVGAALDVVGIGLVATSKAEALATKLYGHLASDASQRMLAETLWAYPLKPGVPLSNPVTRWGPFKPDQTPLSQLLGLRDGVMDLLDRASTAH